ncbi:DinB family protein [Nocardioides aurantiacus]|uniref:DinB family protein n=1 Tax=Nocardioides aurantiacus TaxID=86796 RepID=A0A3N2CQR8_9ACTN|nr:DinB family protein [Nocardioides aurantiacus]ROR89870.1 DinB family protein [Nocardioides aurantiacus]
MSTPTAPTTDWTRLLLEQLEWHWAHQLRPRLEGLSDEEYTWEPVPGCWSVRPRGRSSAPVQAGSGAFTIDFAFPEPEPSPVTTIAWRLGHVVVGALAVRNAAHFGGAPADYASWEYAGTATEALEQLDDAHDRWVRGVRTLDAQALAQPCGEEGFEHDPMAALVLHVHREVVHHGAEVCLLRDLHHARTRAERGQRLL